MNTSTVVVQILIVVVVLSLLIRKRMTPRPLKSSTRLWRIPLILIAIGVYSTYHTTQGTNAIKFTGLDAGYLAVGILISVALGALRGSTIRLSESPDGPTQQYTYKTVALWVLIIVLRLGMDAAGESAGVAGAVITSSILLMFGLTLLGESLSVSARTSGRAVNQTGQAY
jgi:hypothetical protein